MLSYTPTPTQEIHYPILDQAGVRLLIKREDLNHSLVSGNKWWKLKYNLEEAAQENKRTLLTFGGAYSNHVFATAAAASESGFKSIAIIRGEETLPLNETLSFARENGTVLHYISREQYRDKGNPEFIQTLRDEFGDFYLIPEGGTNTLAVKGVQEFAQTLDGDFDYICCPVGTGGTLAGLINGLPKDKTIVGFSSLKGGEFLNEEVNQYLNKPADNWSILTHYHFGGYGKITDELISFQKNFADTQHIMFDLIYGSKMMLAIFQLVRTRYFNPGSTILAIHTGGLQGKTLF